MSGADYGRKACYDAEDATGLYNQSKRNMSMEEAQRYVDAVLADKWVQKHMRISRAMSKGGGIQVIPGRTRGFAGQRGWKPVICLGPWARQPYIILHELAHHFAGLNHGHDRYFCGTLRLLVGRFMGAEAAETLRRSFAKHGVPSGWPQMAPEPTRSVTIDYTTPAPVVRAAAKPPTRRVVDGKVVPCAHCGTVDNVESGGSYGQPLCRRCYYRWRKTLKR